jgi:hypothetical protein
MGNSLILVGRLDCILSLGLEYSLWLSHCQAEDGWCGQAHGAVITYWGTWSGPHIGILCRLRRLCGRGYSMCRSALLVFSLSLSLSVGLGFELAKQVFCCSFWLFIFWSGYLGDQVVWTICPGWPQTLILLISASQAARVIGVSHRHWLGPLILRTELWSIWFNATQHGNRSWHHSKHTANSC